MTDPEPSDPEQNGTAGDVSALPDADPPAKGFFAPLTPEEAARPLPPACQDVGGHKQPRGVHRITGLRRADLPAQICRGKYTPELHKSIIELLEAGNYIQTASALSGITATSVYTWIRKGKADPDGPYGQFALDVARATAGNENQLVGRVGDIAEQSDDYKAAFQAATYLLKIRHSKHWNEQAPKNVQEVFALVMSIVEECCSPEQYAAILDRISQIGGGLQVPVLSDGVAGELEAARAD
jgi:hypothetical protein